MKVLIGCEESQIVTQAFRQRGYEAYSCDIVPTRGDAQYHFQGCVKECLSLDSWDLVILHPPCTAMSLSGNRWYGKGMPRHSERLDAVNWTLDLWDRALNSSRYVALENPLSVIFNHLDDVHYIQPWQFGHGETKKTGFATNGLPPLIPTNVVPGRENRVHRMPPGPDRARLRSQTYPGVAEAIADQWGSFVAGERLSDIA